MRVNFDELFSEFKRVLVKKGLNEDDAHDAAKIFAESSLDGVYSHGINRFPRTIEQIRRGYIRLNTKPTFIEGSGSFERWDGKFGMGGLSAKFSMNRAIEIAKESGIGLVSLKNTNHWLRGGSYGWQAADEGCIGICWTNTMANMPPWGGKDNKIGNNPFIMSIPRSNGEHVVLDMAMSQFSYGKIEEYRFKNRELPVAGGFDTSNLVICQEIISR